MNMQSSILALKTKLRAEFNSKSFEFLNSDVSIIYKIENGTLSMLRGLRQKRAPKFIITMPDNQIKIVDFRTQPIKCAAIMCLMAKIYELALTGKTITKREVYYEFIAIFKKSYKVDDVLRNCALILKCPVWQLRIFGTAKGLISGEMVFNLDDQSHAIERKGTTIPQDTMGMTEIYSSAKLILLVEKDAVFQQLVQNDELPDDWLLITGKGFPDVNTRMLVRRLWDELRIPILTLVDADPAGIEIMSVYRFGSKAMALHSGELACPAIRWLGVHPTDIPRLDLEKLRLTDRDEKKLNSLLKRPFIKDNKYFVEQINSLLIEGFKAEIESVVNVSTCKDIYNMSIIHYISHKIKCEEFI